MGLNWTPTLRVNFSQFSMDTSSHAFLSRARKQSVRPASVHQKNTAMSLITTWINVKKAMPIKKYLASKITQVRIKVSAWSYSSISKMTILIYIQLLTHLQHIVRTGIITRRESFMVHPLKVVFFYHQKIVGRDVGITANANLLSTTASTTIVS